MFFDDDLLKVFRRKAKAGEKAPCSGLLECTKCGHRMVINKKRTVPPCQKCGNSEWIYIETTDCDGGCYITTATFQALHTQNDFCEELELFRWYRDNILVKEPDGKILIEEYYKTAPLIVEKINNSPNAKDIYSTLWNNYLKPCLHHIKNKEFKKVKELYIQMVKNLQQEFLK